MTKKKKISKELLDLFEEDAGKGSENLKSDGSDKFVEVVNVLAVARNIKTWKQFIYYAEQENLLPKDALLFCLKGIMKSWNKYKILQDPDQIGAIAMLLEWEKQITRKKLYVSKELKQFSEWTNYQIPKADKTFQNDMTTFRNHLGIKRRRDGSYTREQLKIYAARASKKGFKGSR